MIDLTRNVKQPHHHIQLSSGFFLKILHCCNCLFSTGMGPAFPPSAWVDLESLELHTDASGILGFGRLFKSKWFLGLWKLHQKLGEPKISIAWQELLVVACDLWSELLSNKRMLQVNSYHCQLQAVSYTKSHGFGLSPDHPLSQ